MSKTPTTMSRVSIGAILPPFGDADDGNRPVHSALKRFRPPEGGADDSRLPSGNAG
jgi:hypothetical protein